MARSHALVGSEKHVIVPFSSEMTVRRRRGLGCALGLAMGARDGRTRGGHAGTADHLLYFTFYLVGGVRWAGVGLLLSVLL